jgi:hypothetical protein
VLELADVTNVSVGDALVFSDVSLSDDSYQSVVVTDVTGTTVTVSEPILDAFQVNTGRVFQAFESWVRWLPVSFDRPGSLKRFQYGTFHFGILD